MPDLSEKAFEDAIEAALLAGGPDAGDGPETAGPAAAVAEPSRPWGGEPVPGGYHRRASTDYDRELCLLPDDVTDFFVITQPEAWKRLREHHGERTRERVLHRLAREIARRGSLDVLRRGLKESGVKLQLAYFRPASGLNEELQRLHAANLFSVVRQLHYSESGAQSLDLVLFLNGLPLFTAELKNPLSGQNVEDAVHQYRHDRDPREPLFAFGRCLAHFAVDPDLIYVTTHLQGPDTRFLPFNQGRDRGAGNPPRREGYSTAYLWQQIWARDSVLDLVRHFLHVVEVEDQRGQKSGERRLLFPRYHQLDAVRRLVAHARRHGPGRRYLIEHSAGSGKSNTIAWLAHQLSTLHDADDRRVFDSIVVVTDRRVLDRQLQGTVRQFEQTLGVVENIDETSRQLKDALEAGKTIIVSTLQKFPVIAGQMSEMPGRRFAVLIDEAHSSQTGESASQMRQVLAAGSLEEAEREEAGEPETWEDRLAAELAARGPQANVSLFAFTATPKPKTLELFGSPGPDGRLGPFSLYSMRQAIEEKFILDVLESYVTYKTWWRLIKKIEDDPKYDRKKASALLRTFVELHEHAIGKKVGVMVEHFRRHVEAEIGGRAKAMIVTRSRLHAVRTKLALDALLAEKGYPFQALVAFSGRVEDGAETYTEAAMNGLPETQTAATFNRPEVRFLVVAEKFQTGFDQPLLHTLYVDKKLSGVHAVQTLSRLNRTHPEKDGCIVLDFANEAETIREAFQPYYETTILSEGTDPHLLYDLQHRLLELGVFTEGEVDGFAELYWGGLPQERLYGFLTQILTFPDRDLLALYHFARFLRRRLPPLDEALPVEVQRNIDMESYRVERTGERRLRLEQRPGEVEPRTEHGPAPASEEELEPLSRILAELNQRFGLQLGDADRVCLGQVGRRLDQDAALDASTRVNARENVRLSFEHKADDALQEIVDTNFRLYKRVTDHPDFRKAVLDLLFDDYLRKHREAAELVRRGESKTLEFKATLRWNLAEGRKDPLRITHAVLKTIAAFLNTEGGDLLIGVSDDGEPLGLDADGFESHDKLLLHLAQVVRNGLGDRAGTSIDPQIQWVGGKAVCVVACQRSPEPVWLKWKGTEQDPSGDLYVRSGPGSVRLAPDDAATYIATRFPASPPGPGPAAVGDPGQPG